MKNRVRKQKPSKKTQIEQNMGKARHIRVQADFRERMDKKENKKKKKKKNQNRDQPRERRMRNVKLTKRPIVTRFIVSRRGKIQSARAVISILKLYSMRGY